MVDILVDEKDKLLDHEYDGIRELDNYLPPWWLALFYITIVFSIVYFLGYEVFGWFKQPQEEYKEEMAPFVSTKRKIVKPPENNIAKILEQKRLEQQKEEAIVPLMDDENLSQGKKIFRDNCLICHGKYGEGLVGPNLTDDYWVHGKGEFEDIVHIVKVGVIEKGMQPWASILGSKRVLQVSSYVMSLKGTNPPNPKSPEGTQYNKE